MTLVCGANVFVVALLAFLKYPQKLDAHDQARLRFTQLDQDHRFMLHSQHFAYMFALRCPSRRRNAVAATHAQRSGPLKKL